MTPGSMFGGRYRVESIAGQGGMGVVLRAHDIKLERTVAIKIASIPEDAVERTLHEARAMAGLVHRNLCRVFEVVCDGQHPYVVMEWIDGIRLDHACLGIPLQNRLRIFKDLCSGVAAIHDAGIIHRDLKPTNILIDRAGNPVVVDFGLAESHASSSPGGTPGFSAPEQFQHQRNTTPAADIYALGAVLYVLLTGKPPTATDESSRPVLPHVLVASTPNEIERICLSCLEHEPAHRYINATALLDDLRRFENGQPVFARPSRLANEFSEQVRDIELQLKSWLRLGHINLPETRTLMRWIDRVRRPESPWVLESRRLSGSLVALYLGGWYIILALAVGLPRTWNVVGGATGLTIAISLFLALTFAGYFALSRHQDRVALVYLVVSAVATPVVSWLIFRETGWLAGSNGEGMGERELGYLVSDMTVPGLLNRQVLAITLIGFSNALILRVVVRSAAFTFLASLCIIVGGFALFGVVGRVADNPSTTLAELGVWGLVLAAPSFCAAIWLDRRESLQSLRLGPGRTSNRDAPSLLWLSIITGVASLSLLAGFGPDWYWLHSIDEWGPPPAHSAIAFAINGLIYLGISYVLDHRGSSTSTLLADTLRWVIPSHILGAFLWLEYDNGFHLWPLWLTLTPILAGAFAYLSIRRQWKPFLISAFVAIGIWYVRCFDRIANELDDASTARLWTLTGATILGVTLLTIGWMLPKILGKRSLD